MLRPCGYETSSGRLGRFWRVNGFVKGGGRQVVHTGHIGQALMRTSQCFFEAFVVLVVWGPRAWIVVGDVECASLGGKSPWRVWVGGGGGEGGHHFREEGLHGSVGCLTERGSPCLDLCTGRLVVKGAPRIQPSPRPEPLCCSAL